MKGNWSVECQRYFIESKKEFTKKGTPKIIANDVRKMHVRGAFIFTDYYRVCMIRRKGGPLYCVKQREKPNRPWWDKTPIKDDEYKWKKEGTYTREQFVKFLSFYIDGAEGAVLALETCPPDNLVDKKAA